MVEDMSLFERTVSHSEEIYRTIFETTGTAMLIVENDTTITRINAEYEKLSGYSKAEVEYKKHWTEFFIAEDSEKMIEYNYLRLNNPQQAPDKYESHFIDKKGNIKHVLINITVLPETKKCIASLMDITELKRVEEELKRYQFLSRHARDILLFVHENGCILEGNDAALKAYGYTYQELISLNIMDLRAQQTSSAVKWQMERAAKQGILFETIHRRKDGGIFPVEVSSQGTLYNNAPVLLSVIRDITDRKQAEDKLKSSEANYRTIFNAAQDAILVLDINTFKILDINKKTCDMFGYPQDEVKQLSLEELSFGEPPYDQEHAQQLIKKAIEDEPQNFEWLSKNKTNRLFWIEVNLKRVFINNNERLLVIARDITERKKVERELQRLSFMDGLTGIANRRYFDRHLEQELQQAIHLASPISLIITDIDFFKAYNDTYGHLAGDDCLRKVAYALQSASKRPNDIVARYGGEEFGIILPSTDKEGAAVVAEKLRAGVEALGIEHTSSSISNYITISLGFTTVYPKPDASPSDLIMASDHALYQSKKEGRNKVRYIGTLCEQ